MSLDLNRDCLPSPENEGVQLVPRGEIPAKAPSNVDEHRTREKPRHMVLSGALVEPRLINWPTMVHRSMTSKLIHATG